MLQINIVVTSCHIAPETCAKLEHLLTVTDYFTAQNVTKTRHQHRSQTKLFHTELAATSSPGHIHLRQIYFYTISLRIPRPGALSDSDGVRPRKEVFSDLFMFKIMYWIKCKVTYQFSKCFNSKQTPQALSIIEFFIEKLIKEIASNADLSVTKRQSKPLFCSDLWVF